MLTPDWRKSTASNPSECVEVRAQDHVVQVRDSKDPFGPIACFTFAGWRNFLTRLTSDQAAPRED